MIYVYTQGTWQQVTNTYVRDDSTWKRTFPLYVQSHDEWLDKAKAAKMVRGKPITEDIAPSKALYTGLYRVTSDFSTATGNMWGTSWGSFFTQDSRAGPAVRHGIPEEAWEDFQSLGETIVFVESALGGSHKGFLSLARNGYTSAAYSSYNRVKIKTLWFFNPGDGSVWEVEPYYRKYAPLLHIDDVLA